MSGLPGIGSLSRTALRYLIDLSIPTRPDTVVLDSATVDSGSTPTTIVRAGNVLVKRTSTGQYVEANHASGDSPVRATVTSAEAADTDWDGTTITTYLDGILVSTVVLAGTDDSTSEVVTALNTSYAALNLPIVASGADLAVLVITAHGINRSLRIESTLVTAYGTAGGAGSYAEGTGTEADFVVLDETVSMLDAYGTAQDTPVRVLRSGHFDESALVNLTAEAKAEFLRRGARFG